MGAIFRTVAAWLFAALFWGVLCTVHVVTLRGIPDPVLTALIRFWARTTLSFLGIRLEFANPSTLIGRKARIVISNHQSTLDLIWNAAICPPAPLAIGKAEVIWIPVLNVIWWALDFVRIDRQDPVRAIAAINRVAGKITRESRSLFIAPEGTRSPDGRVGPFKKGAFHLAISSGADLYPIAVTGAFEAMPKSRFIARPGVIRLHFLPPVPTNGQDAARLATRCRALILAAAPSLRPAEQLPTT